MTFSIIYNILYQNYIRKVVARIQEWDDYKTHQKIVTGEEMGLYFDCGMDYMIVFICQNS